MSPALTLRAPAPRTRLRALAVLTAVTTAVALAAGPSSAAPGDVTVTVNSDGTATYTNHLPSTSLTINRSATEGGTTADTFALAGGASVDRPVAAGTKCWTAFSGSTPVDDGCVVPAMAPNATGTYYRLANPTRFLDTRSTGGALGRNTTRTVQVGGRSDVPTTGVSAVVVNLTATQTTAAGYLTLYPNGGSRPVASSLNFPTGWTGANLVTVPLGADGKLAVYNYTGSSHVIIDVLGWYAKDDTLRGTRGVGAQFQSTLSGDPERLYDSREDPAGAYVDGDVFEWKDTWADGAEADTIQAYALNITAVGATKPGVLSAWGGQTVDPPNASSVNYLPGIAAPNMTVVPAGRFGTKDSGFAIANTGSGSVHIVVDQIGFYVKSNDGGFRFRPLSTPTRILDTRNGTGLTGAFGAGQRRTVKATSVSTDDSYYVVGNLTGVLPTLNTYLTVWSGENARPGASNLNVTPKRTRAASTFAPLKYVESPKTLSFDVYNNAGTMHVLFDAAGTLELAPPTLDPVASTTTSRTASALREADAPATSAGTSAGTAGAERFDATPVRSTFSRH